MKLTEQEYIQESQYSFPYHYIPDLDLNNQITLAKYWDWGLQYLGRLLLIREYLENHKFNSLLDVGCGDGRLINLLSKHFKDASFFGIDYSMSAIKLAESLNQNIDNVQFRVLDITTCNNPQILLQESYDIVSLVEVVEHIEPNKVSDFLLRSSSFLNSDGRLLLTVPSANLSLDPKHYQHFNLEQLSAIVEGIGLIVEKAEYIDSRGSFMNFLKRLLANKIFILNSKSILHFIFKYYQKNHLYAEESNGQGIFLVCKKP